MFNFQLAAKLGRTVNELLTSIDSKELSQWRVFNEIDPFTESRADKRQAITSRILSAGLLHKSGCSIDEFCPVRKPVVEMTVEQINNVLKGLL